MVKLDFDKSDCQEGQKEYLYQRCYNIKHNQQNTPQLEFYHLFQIFSPPDFFYLIQVSHYLLPTAPSCQKVSFVECLI